MFKSDKKELKISSYIAKCEACAHWFCFYSGTSVKCDFCNKIEKLKCHNNPKNLYEFTGAIVENRWRWFNIKELFGSKNIRWLLCSGDCMAKLLVNINKDYKVSLQFSGTYWKEVEKIRFLRYKKY